MVGRAFSTSGNTSMQYNFRNELSTAVLSAQPVRIYTDLDGTLFEFCENPKDVRIDAGCKEALNFLAGYPNVEIIGLTGRDVTEAREMVEDLPINIIGSHGAEFQHVDGKIDLFPFTSEQLAHISRLKDEVQSQANSSSWLHVETNKHGAVGINLAALKNIPEGEELRTKVFAMMERYRNDDFTIAYEGKTKDDLGWEVELRPSEALCGKHIGIEIFGHPDKNALTYFFCDSLGDNGTDRPAAELINDQKHFQNGRVVKVINPRDTPESLSSMVGKPYAPATIVNNPAELGECLKMVCEILQDPEEYKKLLPALHFF